MAKRAALGDWAAGREREEWAAGERVLGRHRETERGPGLGLVWAGILG